MKLFSFAVGTVAALTLSSPGFVSAKTGGNKGKQEQEENEDPPAKIPRRPKDKVVSFQPTFKIHEGKLDEVKALNAKFVEKARNEVDIVHYAIGVNEGEMLSHTREGFLDTEGLLFHSDNVAEEFQALLNVSDVVRFEAIGPKRELKLLEDAFAGLGVIYYTLTKGGFRREIDIMTATEDSVVSFQPTFKIHEGKMKQVEKLNKRFIKKAEREPGIVHYAIGVNDDMMLSHTREGFVDADALLFHASNVADEFAELLTLSDFVRADVIGPAEELEKLKEPLSGLAPLYYFPIVPSESFRYDLGKS